MGVCPVSAHDDSFISRRRPELGQASREQAAVLAGLAAFTRQSGHCD